MKYILVYRVEEEEETLRVIVIMAEANDTLFLLNIGEAGRSILHLYQSLGRYRPHWKGWQGWEGHGEGRGGRLRGDVTVTGNCP